MIEPPFPPTPPASGAPPSPVRIVRDAVGQGEIGDRARVGPRGLREGARESSFAPKPNSWMFAALPVPMSPALGASVSSDFPSFTFAIDPPAKMEPSTAPVDVMPSIEAPCTFSVFVLNVKLPPASSAVTMSPLTSVASVPTK